MGEPIVFVSHFLVKQGNFAALADMARQVTERVGQEKPRTLVYLSFADAHRGVISFLHVFGDSGSMDAHFEGADERSRAAYEFMQPAGWEIYGSPSTNLVQEMRQSAASAGVTLTVEPDFVAGFLRTGAG